MEVPKLLKFGQITEVRQAPVPPICNLSGLAYVEKKEAQFESRIQTPPVVLEPFKFPDATSPSLLKSYSFGSQTISAKPLGQITASEQTIRQAPDPPIFGLNYEVRKGAQFESGFQTPPAVVLSPFKLPDATSSPLIKSNSFGMQNIIAQPLGQIIASGQTIDEMKSVKTLFENMDFGVVTEKYNLAEEWLKQRQYDIDINRKVIPMMSAPAPPNEAPKLFNSNIGMQGLFHSSLGLYSTEQILQDIIINCELQLKVWLGVAAVEKTKLLNRLAVEIEKNEALICQLEMIVNNTLPKETKLSIKLLTNYLRYYARWACMIGKQFPGYKPFGVCGCFLDSGSTLGHLGLMIAPALATGNMLLLGSSPNLFHITSFIAELCDNIGFPKGIILVIPISKPNSFLECKTLKKVTYFGNLYEKSIMDTNTYANTHFTLVHMSPKTTIIFDTADIDSACDSVVHSALTWASQGSLLYVQETIFNEFVQKFKTKIGKLNVGYDATESMLDIVLNKYQTLPVGVEIVNNLPFRIGHKSFGNNILTKDNNDVLSIVPFRTAIEAVNLVNNNNCLSNISLWTENISLANEVTSKLKAGVILINNDCQLNANAPFSLYKGSGCGYVGGKEGFEEYLYYVKQSTSNSEYKKQYSNIKEVHNYVEIAKKGYESWNKLQPKARSELLWKLAEHSESSRYKNKKWIEYLQEWATLCDCTESVVQQGSPALRVIKESIGILAIELSDAQENYLNLVVAALAYGNAVILICKSTPEYSDFLKVVSKIMSSIGIPPGVLNVIYSLDAKIIDTLIKYQEIQAYFTSHNVCSKFKFAHKIKSYRNMNNNSRRDILKFVTKNKCVWTSVGESFL